MFSSHALESPGSLGHPAKHSNSGLYSQAKGLTPQGVLLVQGQRPRTKTIIVID